MSFKNETFFKDILINEEFFFASTSKKLVRIYYQGQLYPAAWTNEYMARTFLEDHQVDYDKVVQIDIDTFATYELDDLFDKGDKVVINASENHPDQLINVVDTTDEIMTELDRIRTKEFVKDIAKNDEVFGLTRKGQKSFILIGDDKKEKPYIMPVWSMKGRALKVRDQDFEECELIEVESSVFGEWLDELRDDNKAVAIDLKPGVVGTIVSAQYLSNEATF